MTGPYIINAIKNLKEVIDLFLEKIPNNISIDEIREHIKGIDGVKDVHHIHIWSMDGHQNYATMHVVVNGDAHRIKDNIREELREHGIGHATLELESENEHCHEENCHIHYENSSGHHHHHHHHHHH